jgi:tetraacyldisaccharide 4'-kinase
MGGPSLLYDGLSRARAAAYARGILETVRVPVPIFCLGNLTVGGSGKTPGVLWLLEELKKRGHRPAIVSRGYGRRDRSPVVLVPNQGEPLPGVERIGDEPRFLARRSGVPLAVGADRARVCARAWEAYNADCLVMDDGFQHHRLFRDRDLICLDARLAFHVFMEGLPTPLLPAGPWREKPEALARAHGLFLTRAEGLSPDRLGALQGRLREKGVPNVAVIGRLSFRDNPTGENISLGELRNQKVLALSGLGDPASFEMSLTRVGALVQGQRYGDHHSFSSRECADVLERARREERRVVVTEKDWERLPETFPALVARLEWELPEEEWPTWIESVFS